MKEHLPHIMVIEDSDPDYVALTRALTEQGVKADIQRFSTGDEALYHLHSPPFPHFILLDLNLPGTDGREVLKMIKQDELLKKIPVVVLTTSNNPSDIQYCYQWGANSYLQKPIDYKRLLKMAEAIKIYWLETVVFPLS